MCLTTETDLLFLAGLFDCAVLTSLQAHESIIKKEEEKDKEK